ncbi:hypothetical protein LNP20_14200 [Klebsiella pneumoniae subsp. pneumoniae]|nr:hypothetical protein [Klebsiella pneumoniae subsp. pneumoniae]
MSQLIDGDLAANNGGWQWAASTGTDAAPYFRIFNPTTQGEKFDKQGCLYVAGCRSWQRCRRRPCISRGRGRIKQGITLDYSRPIVDHKQARQETLAAWRPPESNTPPPDGGS